MRFDAHTTSQHAPAASQPLLQHKLRPGKAMCAPSLLCAAMYLELVVSMLLHSACAAQQPHDTGTPGTVDEDW